MSTVNLLAEISIITVLRTVIALSLVVNAQAATITLLEENFNTENNGSGVLNYGSFTNFDATYGTVDINGYSDFLPGNGLYVDAEGSTSNAGKLSSKSTFVFGSGDLVNLLFKLAGDQRNNGNNSVIVSLGSLFNESFILPSTQGFTTFTRSFTVASDTSAKLAFEGVGGDNIGLLIDDVSLTKSVPQPPSLIGILGLGGFGVTSLRKRKQEKVAVKV